MHLLLKKLDNPINLYSSMDRLETFHFFKEYPTKYSYLYSSMDRLETES